MADPTIYESDIEDDPSGYETRLPPDSDAESLLSPDPDTTADGYFIANTNRIPQQTYIPNPAAQDSLPKTEEAEEERQRLLISQPVIPAEHVRPLPPPEQRQWADPALPILDAGPAPPDYAAATADDRAREARRLGPDHPLVRNGLLGDVPLFTTRGAPESMRDAREAPPAFISSGGNGDHGGQQREDADVEAGGVDERTALLGSSGSKGEGRDSKGRTAKEREKLRWVAGIGIIVFVIVSIIIISMLGRLDDNGNTRSGGTGQHSQPPNDMTPPHPSRSGQCVFNSFSETSAFHFHTHNGSRGFELLESIDDSDFRHVLPNGARISGTIKISASAEEYDTEREDDDDGSDIRVWINVATSDPIVVSNLLFKVDKTAGSSIQVLFPDIKVYGQHVARDHACFDISVAIQVRPNARLRDWRIGTANMDVMVEKGLFGGSEQEVESSETGLQIYHDSNFYAATGDMSIAYWSSRRTTIETTSGNIEGTFALLDELNLKSTSGNIGAQVDPKEADDDKPMPAEFNTKTTSGKIKVHFPDDGKEDELPERDYRVHVQSTSAKIEGHYLLGSSAEFVTTSGNMKISLLPCLFPDGKAFVSHANPTLRTATSSGTTQLRLLEPYDPRQGAYSLHTIGMDYDILDALKSRHKSTSGNFDIVYPNAWTGKIDGKTTSGHIKLRGHDVEVFEGIQLPRILSRVTARKGQGNSDLGIESTSGNINVLIGRE